MFYRTYIDKDTTIVKDSLSNFGSDEYLRLFVDKDGKFSRILLQFDENKLRDLYNTCEFSLENVKHELVLKPYRDAELSEINHITEYKLCVSEIPRNWNGGCGDSACEKRCWDYVNPRCNQSTDSANWFYAIDGEEWDVYGVFNNIDIMNGYENAQLSGNCMLSGGCACNTQITGTPTNISGDSIFCSGNCMYLSGNCGTVKYYNQCVKKELRCENPYCSGQTIGDCSDFICDYSGCTAIVCCAKYETIPYINNPYNHYLTCIHGNCNDRFIRIDLTEYVNSIILGDKVNNGLVLSFSYEYELNIPDKTQMLAFYSSNTETFYKPYIETFELNPIQDDRELFYANKENALYLFTNVKGNSIALDELPVVEIYDEQGDLFLTTEAVCAGLGVYKVDLFVEMDYIDECAQWRDVWTNIKIGGKIRKNVEQYFEIKPDGDYFQFGNRVDIPAKFALHTRGINNEEIIQRGDIRKIFVDIMQNYSRDLVVIDDIYYKIYCMAGREQFLIQDWYPMNRSGLNNWFYLDTSILLPQIYYVDFKILSAGETRTHGNTIKFTIMDKKDFTSVNAGN